MKPIREIFIVFMLVMAVIWADGFISLPAWPIALPAVFFLLDYWRKNPDSFKNLWKPEGRMRDYLMMVLGFLFFWALIASISMRWNPEFWSQPPVWRKFTISVLFYFGNALWQQALVNGYFLPRLEEGMKSEWKAFLLLGLMFGVVHLPNPVLAPVTMIGGILSAYFYKRTRNIYALIIAHSVLAVSIMYFFPHTWHHHLRIGPGYFRCNR